MRIMLCTVQGITCNMVAFSIIITLSIITRFQRRMTLLLVGVFLKLVATVYLEAEITCIYIGPLISIATGRGFNVLTKLLILLYRVPLSTTFQYMYISLIDLMCDWTCISCTDVIYVKHWVVYWWKIWSISKWMKSD